MLETYNNKDIIVRDYTDNFSVKDYISNALIPKAFPNIPINKLNAGFVGVVSEYISQAIEDSYATSSLMLNENFITKAILPNSIYSEAALFDLGYTFATPSRCNFAIQLWADDVINSSTKMPGTDILQYKLDRNTKVILGNNIYHLDYDITINHRYINGKPTFEAQYDLDARNSISIISNRYIKCKVTNSGWIVLFVTLQEFDRKIEQETLSDNIITTNSDISISWTDQIAGLDLTYITPSGERLPMILKIQYSDPEQGPFVYYSFFDDNTINLSFSGSKSYFRPEFNSKIEYTIYTCHGKSANFDSYNPKAAISVEKSSDRYEYNADTRIVAACFSGSTMGTDKKDIELLRDDVKVAYNTAKVLSTDHDLDVWFNNFAKRYDTKSYFFKRRDDPSGRLFSQFVAISDKSFIYPTNTLTIEVKNNEFDFINNDNEFIIKPGHVWEYKPNPYYDPKYDPTSPDYDPTLPVDTIKMDKLSRDTVIMSTGVDTGDQAFITDAVIPQITEARPFMFVNPFYIKINKKPEISALYNYLIHNTSWPTETYINDQEFLHFQLSTMSVDRTISKGANNRYTIRVLCSPVISEDMISDTYKYVNGSVYDNPDYTVNNLRIVMVLKTRQYGETGYIEMYPTSISDGGIMEFEAIINVDDNLRDDGLLTIDLPSMPDATSLLVQGPKAGQIMLDSSESMIDFIVMIKSSEQTNSLKGLYKNPIYNDYSMTNRFSNDYRELVLYKPMTMMRSILTFAGTTGNYTLRASLMPFLKYDIPLDDARMSYFIQAFTEQYAAVEPVIFKQLDNNCHIDFKLFNTYGRSNNYYIGDPDSKKLLDSVHIKINFRLSVIDRTAYTQTAQSVISQIKSYFESLNNNKLLNVYISNLIKLIETNNPNVDHLKFLGINGYDANQQYIRVKYDDISDLQENELFIYVPEMIMIDIADIVLIEES